ncbi:Angiotensin-converting enzyme [Gryllus bimaculatus]|nr:Angiotensin-converting enzyme [Gryllus bimaculatus]
MAARAEDVFRSLGLARLPPAFWRRSQLRADAPAACHGTAANMFRPGDYSTCIATFISDTFWDGANSAFQEAVGDAVTLGVWTPQHLLRLGLVNDSVSPEVLGAQLLVRQALRQLPQLAFALALEEWRWGVFAGEVPPDRYNGAWWELRRSLQGVCPPARRDEADFDPAAKFHVPDNTPYIRYFLSGLLQVQMFKALCEIAVLGGVGRGPLPFPLHQCDIYGSQRAGRKLREMMSLGASRHWTDALFTLTGTRELSAEPLLEYFAPLVPWLRAQLRLHNASLGWGDCPHDY